MESETEYSAQVDAVEVRSVRPLSFMLYEEYCRLDFGDVARSRRERYEEADDHAKLALQTEVEDEVEAFRVWLVKAKNFEDDAAVFCSVGLKSALLGLPVGVAVAELFDAAMRE